MRKFFACFICMFVVVAHAETQSPVVCFENELENCSCYKSYNLQDRDNSDATYNEFLAKSSGSQELEREGQGNVSHFGFLCGYDACAVGAIVVGEFALQEVSEKAVYICEHEVLASDENKRDNYEWVKYSYKDTCHVRDNDTPTEIVKDKLYFYNNEYCGAWKSVASTEYVESTINEISNNIDETYVNTLYNIERSMRTLSAFFAGVEQNVWRNADGKFNTARLASDATAGVILGTAGGLISNKLIKKNQVKKGFEGIGCYVGGQAVAEFGDEFTVGIM